MQQSIHVRTTESASKRAGLVHKESVLLPGEDLHVPGAYRPCTGTWDEFKGDVQMFFAQMRDNISDKYEDARESMSRVLHRGNAKAN